MPEQRGKVIVLSVPNSVDTNEPIVDSGATNAKKPCHDVALSRGPAVTTAQTNEFHLQASLSVRRPSVTPPTKHTFVRFVLQIALRFSPPVSTSLAGQSCL